MNSNEFNVAVSDGIPVYPAHQTAIKLLWAKTIKITIEEKIKICQGIEFNLMKNKFHNLMCVEIRKSGTGRLALPVSILALTYFGFKRYHAEFYKHLMAKNSYEFIYTTSAIENSGLFQKVIPKNKVGCVTSCVFPMVVVSMLPQAEFGPNDHRDGALHFI